MKLDVGGRYAEYLRRSLEERARAAIEGRPADEALWNVHAARASRRVGKADDVLSHAARADELARGVDAPLLPALVLHARAIGLRCARRYDESLAALDEALAKLPAEGHDEPRADILLETAETALETGARAEAGRALARVKTPRDPRLLAWSIYLRSQLEDAPPAQFAAAYETARSAGCPELEWQILWRLSERAEASRDDLVWCAVGILAKLAEPLDADEATFFWRNGPRRVFLDQAQRRYGPTFLHKIMMGGAAAKDPGEILRSAAFLNP